MRRRKLGHLAQATVVALLICGWLKGARADVASHIAYARGLVAFHQAQWSEAVAQFDRALALDSKDARARYYRGLARARMGDTQGAIEDLEQALRDQPDLPHAWLDLGIAYLSAGRLNDARAALERAVERGQERHVAQFFLGLVLYRLGNDARAAELLRQAQADPEVRLPATYYGGLLSIRLGQTQEGRALMDTVAREASTAEIGEAAARYLTESQLGRLRGTERRWSARGRVAFEYDSNVTLGPSTVTIASPRDVTEKSDGRVVALAGLRYRFLEDSPFDVAGGYELSQSVHFDLTRFDLQGHRLSLAVTKRDGRWAYGLAGGYNAFFLNYQSFFHEGLATPWVTWQWAESAATQAFVNFRARDFLRAPYDPGRDALHYAPGLRQYFALGDPRRVLSLGYRYVVEDTVSGGPQGRTFAFQGHALDAELGWLVADTVHLEAGYVYRRDDYDNRESAFGERKRSDDGHQFALGLSYPLTDYLAWTIAYIGQRHDSNERLFEYDRHIVSTGLQLAY
ncbi:MAG: hypothetical protein KatS3mg077_2660 [Candidatus Binatia bacterium]|nr:MAG: hypothetical protein KatS3mg077_2660 [Candidatus Binatia bacterium]